MLPVDRRSQHPALGGPSTCCSIREASMTRVVVCDSHSAIQTAFDAKVTDTDGLELVGITNSVDELNAFLEANEADILILELTLPRGVGVDLIRDLRRRFDSLRIIVYTMYDEAIYGARAVRAGACGYVMKRESTERVIKAVEAALRCRVFVSDGVAAQLAAPEGSEEALLHPTNALSDLEMTVFQLLGEGLPPDEIGARLELPRREIDDLQQQSVEKLGLETREALVQYASRIVHQ